MCLLDVCGDCRKSDKERKTNSIVDSQHVAEAGEKVAHFTDHRCKTSGAHMLNHGARILCCWKHRLPEVVVEGI